MKNLKRILSYILVILWMGMIFYLSHQPAVDSGSLSGGITERILGLIENFSSKRLNLDMLDHIVRKNAHFLVYLILSILVLNALRLSKVKGYRAYIIAFIICVVYAITDEVHQLFIPGRSGEIRDVAIDSLGAIFGIIAYELFSRIRKRLNRS